MLTILISNKLGSRRVTHDCGPFEIGRYPNGTGFRHVVDDSYISGDQLRAEELPGGRLRLSNLSKRVPIRLGSGSEVRPEETLETGLPARLVVGETILEVELIASDDIEDGPLSTLARPVTVIGSGIAMAEIGELKNDLGAARMARWFDTVVAIQRSATSRADFCAETARAVVELVGLDRCIVLFRKGQGWEPVARFGQPREGQQEFSSRILDRVRNERCTLFQQTTAGEAVMSLQGVTAVVASPIFGPDDVEVVGAVYAVRAQSVGLRSAEIYPLEAQLVQVLAAAIGSGTARIGAQAEANRRLVQFEQFFSSELARELEHQPDLLEGREREITVLSSDLRGFSKLTESMPPSEICRLIRDVMDRLTVRIREFHGVVVDYAGDGILAMWNAPKDQPDHALLACRAAQAMQSEVPALNATWSARIRSPLGLGIGINTGIALVGNTGSKVRFKYGPLGNVVNLASRIEGVTKYFGAPTLLSGATREKLGNSLDTRRLGQVKPIGVDGSVMLFELPSEPVDDLWASRRDAFELGLSHFESGLLAEACQSLYPLLAGNKGNYDLAALNLIGRAVDGLKTPDIKPNPVLEMTSK